MTTTMPTLSEEEVLQRDAFVGRLFESGLRAGELMTVYLGDRLGLYRALAAGPATPAELASRAGTSERYTREWLEQQAVAGIVQVDDATAAEADRRYGLPAAHAEVLLERDSLNYLAPLARIVGSIAETLPALVSAYRTGGGVPWTAYGADGREAQADLNRPMYINLLGAEWLPSVPDVHARLQADPPARVADIGCGAGWSSIAIATAYPKVQVDGFDSDEASISLAQQNSADAGVAFRVTFQTRDAADPALEGRYDLVTFFECVHDMARPVEALRTARSVLTEGGAVIIADERVAETFTAPGDDVERFMYMASTLVCLPAGLAEQPSAGTGTVMRPDTLRRYAAQAGFREVEILPIESPFWRFYRLHV
jgi:2-polyprenyl-3-methyl-5-hydroxy-6-metoxy-1,4-benzoquinol methylase